MIRIMIIGGISIIMDIDPYDINHYGNNCRWIMRIEGCGSWIQFHSRTSSVVGFR